MGPEDKWHFGLEWHPVLQSVGTVVGADDDDFATPLKAETKGSLPWSAAERKRIPVTTGFLDYFPAAIAEVAKLSLAGNDQHNPGTPLHWDKSKSTDEADALLRHLMERGTFDTDGQRHSAKVAWRAMALLQRELEGEK